MTAGRGLGSVDAIVDAIAAEISRRVEDAIFAALEEKLAPRKKPGALTRRQLALELQVSESTVDRLLRDGLPHLRIGDSPRFELGCVYGWLRDRERQS